MHSKPPRLTSLQNDQVKQLVRLRNRRERDRQQLVLIEEELVMRRALAAGYPLSAVYHCPELLADEYRPLLRDITGLAQDSSVLQVVEVNAPVMEKISYRAAADGLLALAPQQHTKLADLNLEPGKPALLVILESIEKPGNLGAILRIADGAGADAVVVCGHGTDLFNPNVLRASRGAFFSVPTVACTPDEALTYLAEHEIRTLATSPAAKAGWDEIDLTGPIAVLLGTEHEGLSADLLQQAQDVVGIPMRGAGDSLNVATTTAIILYEAVRQRRLEP